MNPIYYVDFYKVGHISQYPPDVTQVWSNWTPRSSRVPGQDRVIHLGLQYFIKKILLEEFTLGFFWEDKAKVVADYREVISKTLGVSDPRTDHIEALHDLRYLPIKIYSIPEGCATPLNVPSVVITNTLPEFFWLPNYFETMLSATLWRPSTSATRARRYRDIFVKYAKMAGEDDLSFVDWQGHDFSCRGMGGMEDAALSGLGHLLSFSGTDTLPAILLARDYYNADLSCGGSVPATEHSVMCAGTKEDEFETFRRLIEDVYPTGIVSIVSDTWDLWKVLTNYVPRLKDSILSRDGKVVFRPDSGDPVKILCGDHAAFDTPCGDYDSPRSLHPSYWGALDLLSYHLGVDNRRKGGGLIKNAGVIYGDSITEERADAILHAVVKDKGLSPYNCVFGIGSYTYAYVTRDTFGFAMKATAVRRGGKLIQIFKDPITDDGGKRSHCGIPAVYRTEDSTEEKPDYYVFQGATEEQLDDCAFEKVFENGRLLVDHRFEDVRRRARA